MFNKTVRFQSLIKFISKSDFCEQEKDKQEMPSVETQNIDTEIKEEIPNTTKLIIAQRISSIQDADRIILMDDGEINGFGTHEELLETNAIYREVYESQTGGSGDFDEKEAD